MITSMPIGDISDMLGTQRSPSSPRDYLQGYLEYARALSAGEFAGTGQLLERLHTDRSDQRRQHYQRHDGFSEIVGEYIRSLGWSAAPASEGDAFGLDFAIENPATGLYAIGIECDAPATRCWNAPAPGKSGDPRCCDGRSRTSTGFPPRAGTTTATTNAHGCAPPSRGPGAQRGNPSHGSSGGLPMSGPKVVRIVTREEAIATCERDLQRLDKALARWENQASRLAQLSDAERAAAHARRASLHALLEQERWLDVQLQVKIESEFLKRDLAEREERAIRQAAETRQQHRRLQENASALLQALDARPDAASAALRQTLHTLADGVLRDDAEALLAQGFAALASAPPKNASAQPSANSPSA